MNYDNRQAAWRALATAAGCMVICTVTVSARAQYRPDWMWSRATQCHARVAVSPDGAQIAAVDTVVAKLWRASDRTLQHMFLLSDTGQCVAYTSDGLSVIVGEGSRLVRRTVPYGTVVWNVPVSGGATCMAVSPDGSLVATGHADGRLRVWRASDGGFHRQSATTLPDTIRQVGFTQDGANLIGSTTGMVRLWSASSGAELFGLAGAYTAFATSPDGATIAARTSGGFSLFSAADGSFVQAVTVAADLTGLAFSPDGSRLCAESVAGSGSSVVATAHVWETAAWALLHTTAIPAQYTRDTDYVRRPVWILGTSNVVVPRQHLEIVDADTGTRLPLDRCHAGAVPGLACSGDGSRVVSLARDAAIRTWDTSTGATVNTMQMHASNPYYDWNGDLTLTPDGCLAAAWCGLTVQIWDVGTAGLVRDFGYGSTVAFTADGAELMLGRDNSGVWLEKWGVDGSFIWESPFPGSAPRGLSCSPDNVRFAIGTTWGSGASFSVRSLLDCSGYWNYPYQQTTATCFSPDGAYLAIRCPWQWYIHRISDYALVASFGDTGNGGAGAFTRDGRYFAVSKGSGITFYSTTDWTARRVYDVDTPCVYQIVFSPDGSRMFVGTWDGTVRGADMESFAEIVVAPAIGTPGQTVLLQASLADHSGPVAGRTLRFLLDGIEIGAAPTDGSGVASLPYVAGDSDMGTRPITVIFDGDAAYGNYRAYGTLTVTKAPTSLWTIDRTDTITELAILRQYDLKRTTDNVLLEGKTISFRIDGTEVGTGTTNAEGDSTLNWIITDGPAKRTITTTFAGDAVYGGSSDDATLTCLTWATKMSGVNREGKITAYRVLKAWLWKMDGSPVAGKLVTFKLDGTLLGTDRTRTAGLAQIGCTIADGAGAGVRTILAEWAGDGGYLASSCTNTLTVLKATPYIWVMPRSVPQGGVARLYAYFRRLADYQKQEGKSVSFNVDGTWVADAVTGAGADAGIARCNYIVVEPPGVHTIRCEFAGDAWLDAGYGEASLTIY